MTTIIADDVVTLRVTDDQVICVGDTRVTLDTLVAAYNDGATAEEIAQQYPSLGLADIYMAIGYYLRRRDEVEAYLARRRGEAERVRAANEARFSNQGIRERLLARRSAARGQ